ncbi:MAG: TonB-dependent receptor plug domain-containing protein [Saprospiraceae bacterium]
MQRFVSTLCGLFCLSILASGQVAHEGLLDTSMWMIDIDEVVVTAQVAPVSSRRAVHRVRRLDRRDIESRGAVTLDQLLRQELNVRIGQDPVLGSGLSLNGVSGQNVQIMIDGVPIIGRVGDDIDLGQVNLYQIERVEIIEGPMSVQYGTNALGGVVNLITRKSQLKRFEASAEGQHQGIGWTTANASLGFRPVERLLLQVQGGGTAFGGFNPVEGDAATPERTYLWNPKNQHFGGAAARVRIGKEGMVRYSINAFHEEVRNPGILRRPQFRPYAFDDAYRTSRLDHSVRQEGTLGNNLFLQTTAAWNDFRRIKNTNRLDLESGEQTEVPGMQDTARFTSLLLRPIVASRYITGPFQWQAGLDLRRETGYGARIRDPKSARERYSTQGDYALFGSLSYAAADKLLVQLGARMAHNTRYRAPLTPSIHLKYDAGDALTIRASWAKGFRAPALKELFFYFVDANHFILGNDRLRAETSANAQLALDWKSTGNSKGLTSASAQFFYNDITNKIALFQFEMEGDEMVPVTNGGSLQYAYFNQARFRNVGATLRLGYTIGQFQAELGYAPILLYNPLSESDRSVQQWSAMHETSGVLTFLPDWQQLRLTLFLRQNDQLISYYETIDELTRELIAGELRQDGFTIADLTVAKPINDGRITITGGVQNLLNVTNIAVAGQATGTHAAGDSQPVAAGRTFFLRMNLNLGWN